MSNKEGVGDELREKIKQVATEMGYRQKTHSSERWRENATGNIGIVIPSHLRLVSR